MVLVDKIEGEIWMPLLGYEDSYSVSNIGRVKSNCRDIPRKSCRLKLPELLMKQFSTHQGYRSFRVTVNYKTRLIRTHIAVASSFIANPLSKTDVNHKDGNKENNLVENLEWATRSENLKHAYNTGLRIGTFRENRSVLRTSPTGETVEYGSLNKAYKEGFTPSRVLNACEKQCGYKGFFWRLAS